MPQCQLLSDLFNPREPACVWQNTVEVNEAASVTVSAYWMPGSLYISFERWRKELSCAGALPHVPVTVGTAPGGSQELNLGLPSG